jgi:hypothetical protein
MSKTAAFGCRCGAVAGRVSEASPQTASRVVCYCDDCQAYLHFLGRSDLQNAGGGSDVVQVAPATFDIERGVEHIRGVRLKPKGLFRWYAGCCNTPIGNTLRPGFPFVGSLARIFQNADDVFGPPRGAIFGQFAIGAPPPGSTRLNLRLIVRAVGLILGWRLGGKAWPHPCFDQGSRTPRYPVTTLSRAERDALRPHCGPHPAAKIG